jgi:hypothetical protein
VFSYEIELISVKFVHDFLKILRFKSALKKINPQKMLGWPIFKRQATTKMVGWPIFKEIHVTDPGYARCSCESLAAEILGAQRNFGWGV